MPRRALLRAAAAAGTVAALSACARIPTDSSLEQQPLGGGSAPGAPYVQPRPPDDDSSPEAIVLGFVQAAVGPEDDYAVARQYLTPAARDSWDPLAGVTIYPGGLEPEVETLEEGSLRLTMQAIAQVDGRGIRTVLGAPSAREIDLALEQVDGRWRIANPPDGVFLSEATFEILFMPARLYFLDTREQHLVPDLRWFPQQDGGPAVLAELSAGPADVLAPAVLNVVPHSSAMQDLPIGTADDGTAQVDLPPVIARLPAAQRSRALAQIRASLRSLDSLSEVRLVVDGTVVDPDPNEELELPLPGHRPIGAGPTGVISLADITAGDNAAQLVPDLSEEIVASPAIGQALPLAAALRPDGGTVLIASTDGSIPRRDAAIGDELVAPRVDDAGYVWTSARANVGAMLALSGTGEVADARVEAPWLAGREVRAIDMSSDATRMLVLSVVSGSARLELCAVVRDASGVPASLGTPVTVPTGLGDVTGVSWYDELAVLVLGTDPESSSQSDDASQQVKVIDLAHGEDLLPTPRAGTIRVAGTAVSDVIWATTAQGELLRTNSSGWADVALPARDPAFY